MCRNTNSPYTVTGSLISTVLLLSSVDPLTYCCFPLIHISLLKPHLRKLSPLCSYAIRNSQYYEKVSDPLDLSTIEKQILTGHYKTVEAFDTDMLKVFRNAEVGRINDPLLFTMRTAERAFVSAFMHNLIVLSVELCRQKKSI